MVKERICYSRSKLFPLGVDPCCKVRQKKNKIKKKGRVHINTVYFRYLDSG